MKKTTPKDPTLSVAEVAARLGPSENTIYRWCEKGFLAYRKYPSGTVFIAESEVARIERESQRDPVVKPFPESSRIPAKRGTNEEKETNTQSVSSQR